MESSTLASSSTFTRQPVRQDSSSSSSNNSSSTLNLPSRPVKSTRRIATDSNRRNKLSSSVNGMNNGKGKESDEDILRREMEEDWINARRERGVEDGRSTFQDEDEVLSNNSVPNSPNSIRWRSNSSSRSTIPIDSRGSSVSRGKRRKMTIEEDEQIIIKPRPISICSITSSSDGESIYEDARDYFEDIKEEYRKEYELGGTRPLFSLLPSPFPNSVSSRRSAVNRSPRKTNDAILNNNNTKSKRASASTSTSSTGSSPLLYTSDLPKLKENVSRRSWTPKPLVLTPARSASIPLTSPRTTMLNLSSSSGSNGSRPLSPLLTTSDLVGNRRSSMTNSPVSRPGSAMSYIVNSPTSEFGPSSATTNSTSTSRRRKSIGYFESGIDTVLNTNGTIRSRSVNGYGNSSTGGRRNRDSTSSYGADMKRSGSDDSQERESPDSSYDVWEEGERGDFGTDGSGVISKISDILEVVEEVSGLWKSEEHDDDDISPVTTPVIHLSLPSPVQNKTLAMSSATSSSYSHSLATLDESTSHNLDGTSSVTLEPPTPPPPFPLPVLPSKPASISSQQQPDDRYFSNYSDFLLKTRGSGTRSVQSNEVYDAYWDANSPAAAARLNRADSSNYGSEDGSVGSRMLNTPATIARRNTLNKGFPPSPPCSDVRSDSSSGRSSQYGNALEEQKVLKMEDLLDGLIPAVLRVRTSQSMLRPLPPIVIPVVTTTTIIHNNSDLHYLTPESPLPPLPSPLFSSRRPSPPLVEAPIIEPSNFWPPLDDGETKVISLSPRLEALSLEGTVNSKKSNNNLNPGERNLRHQSSLASSTGSRRWSSTPFSSMLSNKSNNKRDSKLSKSTNSSSKMMLCIPVGGKGSSINGSIRKRDSDLRGLDVFGISDDEEQEINGSIASSTGSIIRVGSISKKFSVGSEAKRFFSLSKKSVLSLRSASPAPSTTSATYASNYLSSSTGLGISKDWNGRTTIIASSPPVIPTLVTLSPVDRKVETWTSLPSSNHRYLDNVLETNESGTINRFSNGSSFSGRRPVPNYYLPELLGTPRLEPSSSSPQKVPSPTSLAVAKVLIQGPPSPRIPPPHFQLPDQAPILPHIRQDSDPFSPDLKLLGDLSSSSTTTSFSTTSTFPATAPSPKAAPVILLQHTFPALRGSSNSPHSKSVVLPVKKVKVLEMNPSRVTFRSQR